MARLSSYLSWVAVLSGDFRSQSCKDKGEVGRLIKQLRLVVVCVAIRSS